MVAIDFCQDLSAPRNSECSRARTSTNSSPSIFKLPPELLDAILSHACGLDEPFLERKWVLRRQTKYHVYLKALRARTTLLLVCRRWKDVAENILYRRIIIRWDPSTHLKPRYEPSRDILKSKKVHRLAHRLAELATRGSPLLSQIQELALWVDNVPDASDARPNGIAAFVLNHTKNLRALQCNAIDVHVWLPVVHATASYLTSLHIGLPCDHIDDSIIAQLNAFQHLSTLRLLSTHPHPLPVRTHSTACLSLPSLRTLLVDGCAECHRSEALWVVRRAHLPALRCYDLTGFSAGTAAIAEFAPFAAQLEEAHVIVEDTALLEHLACALPRVAHLRFSFAADEVQLEAERYDPDSLEHWRVRWVLRHPTLRVLELDVDTAALLEPLLGEIKREDLPLLQTIQIMNWNGAWKFRRARLTLARVMTRIMGLGIDVVDADGRPLMYL